MKKTQATILIIDDQEEILIAGKLLLKRLFETIITCSDPKKIPEILLTNEIDVVLMDMNFRTGYEDGKEGVFWLKEILQLQPKIKVILMTSYGSVETAVESLKLGAIDYLLKPWDNEKLIDLIKGAIKQHRKIKQVIEVKEQTLFIGRSSAIEKVYKMTNRVAKTEATILILGENGTGKTALAKAIHENSNRNIEPFVHVDLGSLNENLFESELFGYTKGAFTDAKQDTIGRFESANGGTIFLDEIGNIPLYLQAKLLQVIQNKEIIRLGESKPRKVDFRIITATNTNLEEAVKNGLFREDLYYRINAISVRMPNLNERQEDIIPLINYFLEIYADKYEMNIPKIDEQILNELQHYEWNGNIRELQNRVERAVILSENDEITLENLGFDDAIPSSNLKNTNNLNEIERQKIIERLHFFEGNITKTAEDLGVSRASLYRKLEKYNIAN